jgi:hypothetical protein
MGKPLGDVRRVYVQLGSDNASSQEFLTQLRTRMAGEPGLQLADVERADAALKVEIRPASAGADDPRVTVTVRAVNANGYVVWPGRRRGSGWRYVGRPMYVASQLVSDLNRDIQGAKRR